MSYNILLTKRFEKELKKLLKKFPSLKRDFANLIDEIKQNPETGTFIGNSCFKIRIAIASKEKGKRAGARVITHLYIASETVYLLTICDKSEKTDLRQNELEEMVNNLNL